MLKLLNISKRYGTTNVLCGVSISCAPGEAVCLAGANAAGKTTLLNIATGLEKSDAGNVICDGNMGFVSQENAQMEDLNVKENLLLWYAAFNRSRKEVFSIASPESELGLVQFCHRKISELSGGIKKRLAIACAMAGHPVYLLMDEPFTALDLKSKDEICQLLCKLKKDGIGILFSSHDPSAIAAVADRVLLLQDGLITDEIIPDEDPHKRVIQMAALLCRA